MITILISISDVFSDLFCVHPIETPLKLVWCVVVVAWPSNKKCLDTRMKARELYGDFM